MWPWGGQFSGPLVVPSAVYDVKGHPSTAAKENAKVEYEIVAQISVFLDVSLSTVRQMTELVERQIGLDVVLLDS